jgi:hypothetical protein
MAERPGSSASFGNNPLSSQTCLKPDHKPLPKNKKKKNPISRCLEAIWATKETKADEDNSDVLVKTTLKELIIYILFMVVITISNHHLISNHYFYLDSISKNKMSRL